MRTAVGYCRVSTDDQAQGGYSIGEQDRLIRERAAAEGWRLRDVISDPGYSGATADRPGLLRLLTMLDEVDIVVVWAMDRLTRDLLLFARLAQAFNDAGVRVESLTAHVDLLSPEGEAMAGIAAVFGQFERKRIGERVKVAMAARVRQGKPHGRCPYGYRPDHGDWKVVPAQAAVIQRVHREYLAGRSQQAIARDLTREGIKTQKGGAFHQGTLSKLLRSRTYLGEFWFRGEWHPGTHEPIIDEDTWQAAQRLRTSSGKLGIRGRRTNGVHLFRRGQLKCGSCGESMVPQSKGDIYTCASHRLYGPGRCPTPNVKRALIDEAVLRYFESVAHDFDGTRAAFEQAAQARVDEAVAQRRAAARDAQRAQADLDRVRRDYVSGAISAAEWRSLREGLESESEAAQAALVRLTARENELRSERTRAEAEGEVQRHLDELREAVASAQGEQVTPEAVDPLRAALRRTYSHFTLHVDPAGAPVCVYSNLMVQPQPGLYEPWAVIEPHPRSDLVDEVGFPVVEREPLILDEGVGVKDANGLLFDYLSAAIPLWAPIEPVA